MAKGKRLTAKQRKAMPQSDYAMSGKRFPIEDAAHRKAALMDAKTPAEKKAVKAAIARKTKGGKKKKG